MDFRSCKSQLPTSNGQFLKAWKLDVGSWKLFVAALLALGIMIPPRAASTETAMLKRIASRVDDHAGVISIEASDPVPYVASQPDPKTFVVEMRDVLAVGFADNFKVDPRRPIASIAPRGASSAPPGRPAPSAICASSGAARRRPSRSRAAAASWRPTSR